MVNTETTEPFPQETPLPREETLSRLTRLLGGDAVGKLEGASVLLFGLGGVGSYAFEGLVRSGIGRITVVDRDEYEPSNLNRQLYATRETVGQPKVDAAVRRAALLFPSCRVEPVRVFLTPENAAALIDRVRPDVMIDAIDNVSAKIAIALHAAEKKIPLCCCLGTGNRLDPTKLRLTDLFATSGCPLARVMLRELRKRGLASLPVLVSDEEPIPVDSRTPASCAFVPAAAGMSLASWAVRTLIRQQPPDGQ